MRALVTILLLLTTTAHAGALRDAVNANDDVRLRFEYATREGVFGDGRSLNIGGSSWNCDCEEGPARIEVRVRDGVVRDVDVRVGGRWRDGLVETTDLGELDPLEAADDLLWIASTSDGDVEEAILGAIVAEGFEDHARLVGIARDDARPDDVRESAVFWLGQAASDKATAQLTALVDDDDEELSIREHAIFALSQRPLDECFEPLKRVATSSRHPQLREKAFFWLAQHDDDRVVDFLESVLLARN